MYNPAQDKRIALLIVDIQNDYFEGGTMALVKSAEACKNAQLLLRKFREENLPVIFIQHVAIRPTATFFLPGTPGAAIHGMVKPLPGEKIITKHFPNSFRETDLLSHLHALNVAELAICGMMTHMCIDATARAAKDYGFGCTIIGDGCATKDLEFGAEVVRAEDVQRSFLAALSNFYSAVTNTNQYLGGL